MTDWVPNEDTVFVQNRLKIFGAFILCLLTTLAFLYCALNPDFLLSDTGSSTTRSGRQGDALKGLLGDKGFVIFFWVLTGVLLVGTIILFMSLFKPPRLILNDKGLKLTGIGKAGMSHSWEETSPFILRRIRIQGITKKYIKYSANVNGKVKKRTMPATGFGIKAEKLAELLNNYREQALLSDNSTFQKIEISPKKLLKKPVATKAPSIETASTAANLQPSNSQTGGWQPPGAEAGYAIRSERAPWVRWFLAALIIGAIILGAAWLISKVVVPGELPNQPVAEQTDETDPAEPVVKKSSDDEAWVKALEKDTLEGYREYLELFPEGKHKDDAQAEIDKYDNKAWGVAEQRQTLSGYEDYLEAWPEGLHASKAREKIAEIKARAEAIAKDAAERAARDAADWDAAALENTLDSYGRYLTQQPRGKWVTEAQNRIAAIKADQAATAASAAERQAWEAAKAANRADSYQQYISSYPQGTYVPQAIAAIEQLKPSPGRTFQDCDVCPLMVSVPPGNANLGAGESEEGARPNEKPQRPVTFSNLFAIGVHEVTFDEWQACVSDGGCTAKPRDNGWGGGSRPVINITWDQAQGYASWLSQKTGFNYSLPSEAQWEYAARGGKSDLYVGGSLAALCAFANGAGQESGLGWANQACTDLSRDRTQPVGLLSANGFGVKDIIGNVAEWTLDCNTLNLRDAPADGRADQRGSCNQRAVRGGSWFSGPADLRYAARLMQRRGDSNDFTGLRVVRKIDN